MYWGAVLAFAQEALSLTPDHPFSKYPDYVVLKHPATGKWAGVLMSVPRAKLGLTGTGEARILNLKCGELVLGSLLGNPGYLPAYHMSKAQWVSVLLDGTASLPEIERLLELSYEQTRPKVRKRR